MRALGSVMAGGLLAGMALIATAGSAVADDADASGADAPRAHDWNHDGDGDGHRQNWNHDGHHDWHHHQDGARMFHELGLTDAQRASMKSIMEAARPAMKDLHDQLRANMKLLQQTTPDDRNYSQLVSKVSQENGALMAKLMAARSKVFAQCYAVLAPIQKTRLAEVRAQHAKWTEERMQHMHDHLHHDGAMDGTAPPPPPK